MENTMKYFRKDNTVYAYDDEQLAMGYGKDMTPMTDEEVELHINPTKTAEQIEAEAKAERLKQLEVLTVTTTNGNTFDANNQARLDMSNGIQVSEILNVTQTVWRMADDTEVLIQIAELKEALAKALQAYATLKGIG